MKNITQFYPPEEMIREEFLKSVEEAERRVKEGKATSFKDVNELKAFLDSLWSLGFLPLPLLVLARPG